MARIVAVHGIAQQGKGPNWIHRDWFDPLCDGLRYSGIAPKKADLVCPAYGDLFRREAMGMGEEEIDEAEITADDEQLIRLVWAELARVDPQNVIAPDKQIMGLHHRIAHKAFEAICHSRRLTNLGMKGAAFFIRSLKQVTAYMEDPRVRLDAREIVSRAITDDTRVVVGHSLGSVVSYEVLCENSRNVRAFVTLGSPLGIRNLIFDRLRPAPVDGRGQWPGGVARWYNFADENDVVALQKRLSVVFGERVQDAIVDNDLDAHEARYYLTDRRTGEAIAWGLQP